MPMIQGIDGGLLINALRQGREDRFQDDARRMAMAKQQAAEERQRMIDSTRQRATGFGAPQQSGVAGQFMSPAADQMSATGISGGVAGMMAPTQPMQPAQQQGDPNAMLEWLAMGTY